MWFKKIPIWIKVILLQIFFLILHYLYDWFPNMFTTICSGINESVYQHMKIGFFAYILLILIELLLTFKAIESFTRYVFSRLFAATYLPMATLVIFLISPMVFGHIENILLEIIFANIALIITSLTTLIIEKHVEKTVPGLAFKIIVIFLFVISLAQFIVFTFELPWFDVFAVPPGW